MSDLYPEGNHLAKCKEWALTETKAGDPQVFLKFEDVDGREPPPYFGGFGERSLPHTLKALRACGWTGTDITEIEHAQCGLDSNQVSLKVEHEEYEGKTRAKTRFVNVPGAALKALDPAKKASFAQSLKANILALEMNQPKPTKPQSGPPPGHPANAEIPF